MLKNMVERQAKELIEFSIEFTDAEGSGYTFPCDSAGNVQLDNDAARENYQFALAHPEKFPVQFNEFTRRTRTYTENAHGTCVCGEEVELYDQYRGACQCPKCERWYNLFGQRLIDPQYWEDDGDEY